MTHRGYGSKGELRIDISGLGGRVHIRHKQVPVVQADLEHLISLNIRDVDHILQAHDQGLLVLMALLHDADVRLRHTKHEQQNGNTLLRSRVIRGPETAGP